MPNSNNAKKRNGTQKKSSAFSLSDTGERMIPSVHKGKLLYGEHIVRYEAVLPVVKGMVVLDIASGSGYGSKTLSKSAKKVYGVDLDKDAVDYAKKNYSASNIEFLNGSGTDIPLPYNSVDVVVTFETIEHIENYQLFLKEIKRVLVDGGLAVVSTPNELESPPGNHFHVHEFEYEELTRLLNKNFKFVAPYFQGTWLYNALFNQEELNSEWRREIETISLAPINAPQTMYYFYVCSDTKITKKLKSLGAISEHYSVNDVLKNESIMRGHMEAQRKVTDHLSGQLEHAQAENTKNLENTNNFKRSIWWMPYRITKKIKNIMSIKT